MDPAAQHDVFGLLLSNAEYQLLLEAIKATLFAAAGALIAFLFQSWGKRRELDTQLFNQLVKPKIATLHDLNSRIVAAISSYLGKLDQVIETPLPPGEDAEEAAPPSFETARRELQDYLRDEFSSRVAEIKALAQERRYVIGETSYRTINLRLETLAAWVKDLWSHHTCVGVKKLLQQELTPEEWLRLSKFQYRTYARLSGEKMVEAIDALRDDFEMVIRRRGTARIARLKVRGGISEDIRRLDDMTDAKVKEAVERLEHDLMSSEIGRRSFDRRAD